MPGMSDESKQDFRNLMKEDHKELAGEIVQGFTEALKSIPQPAAPAAAPVHQDDCPGCKQRDGEIGELKGKVQSWEKGEQFLAFDPALHATHPDSKPKVDEYFKERILNVKKDDLTVDERKKLMAEIGPTITIHTDD